MRTDRWLLPPPQEWIERHVAIGHHPYPNPTGENPERGDCECALSRILTIEQTRRKFAQLRGNRP
jgi:hypothetical protein